jgi:hypothetical protein
MARARARATRAGTDQKRARLEREQFEVKMGAALESMKQPPTVTGLATNDPTPLAIQFDDESRPRKRFFPVDPDANTSSRAVVDEAPRAIERSIDQDS